MMTPEQQAAFTQALIDTLRDKRKARGISHERLAAAAGISRQTIGKIESNLTNPTMLTVYKIATALDLNIDELTREIVARMPDTSKPDHTLSTVMDELKTINSSIRGSIAKEKSKKQPSPDAEQLLQEMQDTAQWLLDAIDDFFPSDDDDDHEHPAPLLG